MGGIIYSTNHKERYLKQKVTLKDPHIERFLNDLKIGLNVGSMKGSRSYARLYTLRNRLRKWEEWITKYHNKTLTTVNAIELQEIYYDLETGIIEKQNGQPYVSYGNYGQDIKTFWSWYVRHMRREHDKTINNVTDDIDTSSRNGTRDFHYLTKEQFESFIKEMPQQYRPLMWFMFDSGIRPDKELLNVRVSDITPDTSGKLLLHIREETAKTFGRKFKLHLCSDIIKEYIKKNNLKGNDFLFNIKRDALNKALRNKAHQLFGFGKAYYVEEKHKDGYARKRKCISSGFHLYDIRHCSACYWVTIFKKDADMKYRFGWKKSDKIYYYTHFLGLEDKITEEDLYTAEDKTRYEKRIVELEKQLAQQQDTIALQIREEIAKMVEQSMNE